jgi:hypothetical protein
MPGNVTLDELRVIASQAGLAVPEDELKRLLPVVNRSRVQAADLRALMSDGLEPAGNFDALKQDRE